MKKNGAVANVFSGVLSIFVAIFLFFLAVIFCLIGFLADYIEEFSLNFILVFEPFVDSAIDLVNTTFASFNLSDYVVIGVIAGLILVSSITYFIAAIKQIKISKLSLEGYKSKKKTIVTYLIFEIFFFGLLVAATILNIIDVLIFAIVIGVNVLLKLLTCIQMTHAIRKGKDNNRVKIINPQENITPVVNQPIINPQNTEVANQLSNELSKLVTLKVEGVISQEEYDARRAEIERKYSINNTKFSG